MRLCMMLRILSTLLFSMKKKNSGVMKSISRFACTFVDRRGLVSDIQGITKRISKVTQDMKYFGVKQMISDHILCVVRQEKRKERQHQFAKSTESNLVGLEGNVKTLVGYLADDHIQIISATGMGGLGKTTLARQVFEHDVVRKKFKRFAWVCVTKEFTRVSVWQTILLNLRLLDLPSKEVGKKEIRKMKDEIHEMKEAELQDELYQLFETSTSLIILDDIWRKEDWERIKPIFPPTKGWKVLLTSRIDLSGGGDAIYSNLKPGCLTLKDSWTLFERIVPMIDTPEFKFEKEMKELAEQMVKQCGGLPLAIKVLGGLLGETYTPHDWKRLSENIRSNVMGENDDFCYHVLSLSYEELPVYLKRCFLYLAHFPEDWEINVGKLSYCWAAEGISNHKDYHGENNIRDIGDRYIEELAKRNMVIAVKSQTSLRYEICHMHDMMREICVLRAKEEKFLQIISNPPTANIQSNITTCRWVSHERDGVQFSESGVSFNPKLRSLMVIGQRKGWLLNFKLSCSSLKLLRVLDISRVIVVGGKNYVSGIGKFVHLRYMCLKSASLERIPCSLGNLKLLIYLNLDVQGMEVFVPNVLMGMLELRYLALPLWMHDKVRLELSNLINLESLINFSTKNSSLEDIHGMVKLKVLKIQLCQETSMETISTSIGRLRNLESLHIFFQRRIKDKIALDFPHLKRLIVLERIPRLPKGKNLPSCLTLVRLRFCYMEEDPMPILENLVLLKEVDLYLEAFVGRRMVCSGGGFPRLLTLEIDELSLLEEWIIEEGSMPLLESLTIRSCPELKELPDGLRFITSIENLMTDQHREESLSEGGQEYCKVGHIPRITFV